MTCPTCNGQLAALLTSTYCPACDAKALAKVVEPQWSSDVNSMLDAVDRHTHGSGRAAAPAGTLVVTGNMSSSIECVMLTWDGEKWTAVTSSGFTVEYSKP